MATKKATKNTYTPRGGGDNSGKGPTPKPRGGGDNSGKGPTPKSPRKS